MEPSAACAWVSSADIPICIPLLAVPQHCAHPCSVPVPPCRANRLRHGSSLRQAASLQDSGEQSSKANQRALPCSSEDHRGNPPAGQLHLGDCVGQAEGR